MQLTYNMNDPDAVPHVLQICSQDDAPEVAPSRLRIYPKKECKRLQVINCESLEIIGHSKHHTAGLDDTL